MKCLKWKKVTLQLTWMSFLKNCEVCLNQERLPITYHNFRHKSLVRPKSKSPNWQGSQPINYKAKISQRDNTYPADLKYNITYQNIQGEKLRSDRFLYPEMLIAKKLPSNLNGWVFLQNLKVCFNQECLPIMYHNFRHQSLVRPRSKCSNWKGAQPISYKANFSLKGTMYLIDVKFNITYQNKQRIIKVRQFLRT